MIFDKHDPKTFAENGIKYPCKYLQKGCENWFCEWYFPQPVAETLYHSQLCRKCELNKK